MAGQKNGHGGRFAFACAGLLISFILPQKWTSSAVITPAEAIQWQDLEKTFTKLRVLDLDINIDRGGAFNLFIKRFQSVSLLEEYLRSSPYVMDQLKEAKIDELDLHRAIVALKRKNRKRLMTMPVRKKMNRHCIPPGR